MAPEWLSEKKFKLLEYKHIIYCFKTRDLEISEPQVRVYAYILSSKSITGCQIPVLFLKSTPELGRIFSNFISRIKQSYNFPKTNR